MTDVVRIGSEIRVNTATAGDQLQPQIALLSNGGFVVTWLDWNAGGSIKAQTFAADGTKIGSEILVSTAKVGVMGVTPPQVTALSNGGFAVTWFDNSKGVGGATGDASGLAVKAQVFAADAAKVSSEILVNTTVAGDQKNQRITALSNGGFVVTWDDSQSDNVRAQAFAADGAKVGSEIRVSAVSAFDPVPQIVTLSNGGFVVTWKKGDAVEAQVFAADATKVGSEILVNVASSGLKGHPQITALSNGGFVVTWEHFESDNGIEAQVFAADGTKVGSEIQVDTATAGSQQDPQITALSNGGFVVTWNDGVFGVNGSKGVGGATGDASQSAIKAQIFAADGTKIGSEILVDTATAGYQLDPQITALSNGGFVVTWSDGTSFADGSKGVGGATGDASGAAVKAQAFAADGTRIGSEILVNSTTIGNQENPVIKALSNNSFVVAWEDSSLGVEAQVFGLSSEPATRDDFDGNGASDLLIQNTDGVVAIGSAQNGSLAYSAVAGLGHEWTFEGNGDFFGDGAADFLVQHENGAVVVGDVQNGQAQYAQVAQIGSEWKFKGAGDFLGAGSYQFLIENGDGAVVVGDVRSGQAQYAQVAALGSEWKFVGSGDFLGTGRDSFLIENTNGAVVVGDVQNGQAQYTEVAALGSEWTFVGTGDFLGLGHDEFLIKNDAGAVVVGDVQNGQAQYTQVGGLGLEWSFLGTGDYLGDGSAGFVIENTAGAVVLGTIANGQASYAQIGGLGSEWVSHS